MQQHFSEQVEKLKTNLVKMASLVDEQVERAIKALETGDIELCKGMKAKDLEIDEYDNLIQSQGENILALFQPVAVDLRFIISALMINNQLERCGDIAVNISQRVKKVGNQHPLVIESHIIEMGRKAKEMLKNAIDSFIHNDTALANEVRKNDEEVDKLNKEIFRFLIAKMRSSPELIEPSAHLIVLTRHIERLADHSTNIAENLVFYVDAKIVTHQWKLSKEKKDEGQ
ncbi:MAG TPA: phosphate signaling complex protein PhoU [Ignavibacteriaceae bacterium]|nr:phosphate signaling complex protein PhoU [Ignavibacteriaceae bacterium]